MKLEKVVPFGRSLEEYTKIFDLVGLDLNKNILGVGDGPASFNAEATKMGEKVTSIDPIYKFSAAEISARFNEVIDDIINQVKATPNDWVWKYHKSPEDLRKNRIKAIELFLQDYDRGKEEGRYQTQELPNLSFEKDSFDLALCSHFLFLYSEQYNYQFHYDSILEMLRVSKEARIFPLLTLMLEKSPHLDRIIEDFTALGYLTSIVTVEYELQKGGDRMLVIKKY